MFDQRKVLALVAANPEMTVVEIAKRLNIKASSVRTIFYRNGLTVSPKLRAGLVRSALLAQADLFDRLSKEARDRAALLSPFDLKKDPWK